MTVQTKADDSKLDESSTVIPFEIIALFLLLLTISYLARLFLGDTKLSLILVYSTFLFRFLLGGIVVIISKYVLGLRTYGMFGVTILVLSMIAIGPFWGTLMFINIFILGYIARYLIQSYNLAVGFRVGILMTFVICYISLLELIGESYRISFLSATILVPILITPWYIDRYSNEIEEKDHYRAFIRLVTTILLSLAAYVIMSLDFLIEFIVLNPETWILILAIYFYLGRSQKYTYMDKLRFKQLFSIKDDPLTLLIRNRDYIARYNAKILFPLINKFDMKERFEKWQVPTPELYAVIESEKDVNFLMNRLCTEDQFSNGFVLKPSKSFGGKGIFVITERTLDKMFIIDGKKWHPETLEAEIRKILGGEYLTSQTSTDNDVVLIEERISTEASFSKIGLGLPDVRVIVFRGIPVMAMARLPTHESGGKANLKQGAIGAAIRLSDGVITNAIWKGHSIKSHPDTRNIIKGFRYNKWKEILAVACLAQKSSGLGYTGVDVVLEDDGRILVLEVNKRPGLEIQNINQQSLLGRFQYIEGKDLDSMNHSPLKSASLGMELSQSVWCNANN
ncbi:MAG: sugar-transfer associated ATP-grasp domain-containing protein [Candidatus Heimdallarchaeota archaeon]